MNNKELIRRALMGDKQAQKECIEKGIALPCPFCGEELRDRKTRKWTATKDEPINRTVASHKIQTGCYFDGWSIDKATELESWNARSALPIGRCGECMNATNSGINIVFCDYFERDMMPDDFCSCFEPRGENNE